MSWAWQLELKTQWSITIHSRHQVAYKWIIILCEWKILQTFSKHDFFTFLQVHWLVSSEIAVLLQRRANVASWIRTTQKHPQKFATLLATLRGAMERYVMGQWQPSCFLLFSGWFDAEFERKTTNYIAFRSRPAIEIFISATISNHWVNIANNLRFANVIWMSYN